MFKFYFKMALLASAIVLLVGGGCVPSDSDMSTPKVRETTKNTRTNPPRGDSKPRKSDNPDEDPDKDYPPAPKAMVETELKALDGEDFKLSDFKGKVVLVNLWATWCGPCVEEMPYFNKMQTQYADKGFQVIGLNTDEESEAQVRTFVKQQELNYRIGWAEREVTSEFMKISKLPGIPQSILLNRNGEMIGLFRGGGQDVILKMVETVDKLMSEDK